jgi:hypothetical protein
MNRRDPSRSRASNGLRAHALKPKSNKRGGSAPLNSLSSPIPPNTLTVSLIPAPRACGGPFQRLTGRAGLRPSAHSHISPRKPVAERQSVKKNGCVGMIGRPFDSFFHQFFGLHGKPLLFVVPPFSIAKLGLGIGKFSDPSNHAVGAGDAQAHPQLRYLPFEDQISRAGISRNHRTI